MAGAEDLHQAPSTALTGRVFPSTHQGLSVFGSQTQKSQCKAGSIGLSCFPSSFLTAPSTKAARPALELFTQSSYHEPRNFLGLACQEWILSQPASQPSPGVFVWACRDYLFSDCFRLAFSGVVVQGSASPAKRHQKASGKVLGDRQTAARQKKKKKAKGGVAVTRPGQRGWAARRLDLAQYTCN